MAQPYFVFFDVDHTLIRGSTGLPFAQECLRLGLLGPLDVLRVLMWAALHYLGRIQEEDMWRKSLLRFKGYSEEDLKRACRRAQRRKVRHRMYREALEVIQQHRQQGGTVALISAAPRYSVLAIADQLGIEHTATAWPNIKDGKIHDLDGVVVPFGPAKRRFAESLCQAHQVAPQDCWAFGDSRSDIEMLDLVGHPVAVNPKPALREVAQQRGWQIVRWAEAITMPRLQPAACAGRAARSKSVAPGKEPGTC